MVNSRGRSHVHQLSLALVSVAILMSGLIREIRGQEIQGLLLEDIEKHRSYSSEIVRDESPPTKIHLCRAVGNLEVVGMASTETYEAYFHIPISFNEQVPILIEVESPELIDYRFIHLGSPNVIIAARLHQAPSTPLDWTAWIL